MSDKPISPLRARMIQDMTVRNFVPDTQREYIRAVKKLASFLGRAPDTASAEDLRLFQVHLTETGANPPTINATVTALRFFFKVTLDRPETTRHLVFVFEPRKLPRVLPPEDVLRLLEAAPNPKSKAALSVAYGAGLRAMEVVALKITDIDSQRMPRSLVLDRQRNRSSRWRSKTNGRAPIDVKDPAPRRRNRAFGHPRRPATPPHNPAAHPRHINRRQPIPIEFSSHRRRQTSRGFLHWRLPDDGPFARGNVLRAVIWNPSHK